MVPPSPILKDGIFCGGGCDRVLSDGDYFTEINPPGGYGRGQLLVCDECMRSGEWDHWIAEHWPNWPDKPRSFDHAPGNDEGSENPRHARGAHREDREGR